MGRQIVARAMAAVTYIDGLPAVITTHVSDSTTNSPRMTAHAVSVGLCQKTTAATTPSGTSHHSRSGSSAIGTSKPYTVSGGYNSGPWAG